MFSVSLGAILTPKRNWRQCLRSILGWQTKSIMVRYGIFWSGHCELSSSYIQTGKTVNTRNSSEMLLSWKRKANQVWENSTASKNVNLVCGFVASSHNLIFAVIGHNTINIPKIFQVFTVFPVALLISLCTCRIP